MKKMIGIVLALFLLLTVPVAAKISKCSITGDYSGTLIGWDGEFIPISGTFNGEGIVNVEGTIYKIDLAGSGSPGTEIENVWFANVLATQKGNDLSGSTTGTIILKNSPKDFPKGINFKGDGTASLHDNTIIGQYSITGRSPENYKDQISTFDLNVTGTFTLEIKEPYSTTSEINLKEPILSTQDQASQLAAFNSYTSNAKIYVYSDFTFESDVDNSFFTSDTQSVAYVFEEPVTFNGNSFFVDGLLTKEKGFISGHADGTIEGDQINWKFSSKLVDNEFSPYIVEVDWTGDGTGQLIGNKMYGQFHFEKYYTQLDPLGRLRHASISGDASVVVEFELPPPEFTILDAKMVSPNELGIGVSVKYPLECPQDAQRFVKFAGTINGIKVSKIIEVTQYTKPDVEWGKIIVGTEIIPNEMFDSYGELRPDTPLRINLADEQVVRFTDDVEFDLYGAANYTNSANSIPSSYSVKILLPVVVLHGWKVDDPEFFNREDDRKDAHWAAYQSFSSKLVENGYKEMDPAPYVTLWDPEWMEIGYGNMFESTPEDIQNNITRVMFIVRANSYANKVNFVGHSTGGLVARFYAYQRPQDVNKVITIGTPHKGITEFYIKVFNKKYSSRSDAEKLGYVTGTNEENAIRWFVPTYDCLIEQHPEFDMINPYFDNTFQQYGLLEGVEYHSIYATNHKTPYQIDLKIELKKYDEWYSVKKIIYTEKNTNQGDDYVLALSAELNKEDFGIPYPQVTSHPVITGARYRALGSYHGGLLNDNTIQQEVLKILKGDNSI